VATIYDVAALAKVSAKTVSRVLNGDAPVSRDTREAIEAAIAELGFVPSNAARMMRSQKSGLVGLITGAISLSNEPTQPQGLPDLFIVQGIQRAMAASGKTLMIADTGGQLDRVPHLIQTFLRHRVEGLIYVAEYHQKVELPRMPATTPMVLANCFDEIGTPAVLPDDQRGQRDLVARLLAAGHRRIAYLTLPNHLVATKLRTAGYAEALAEAGIAYDPALVECADYDGREDETQILWDTIDRMLRLPEPPTVLCCGNDKMAMRVYGILRSRGLKVPDEISVAGYDNYRIIAETLFPPLTTVELAYVAIGVRAAQRLMALISDPASAQAKEDREPALVSGPVYWRGSVTERSVSKVSNLKIVRED
jgi:LacI family transcriptional regulator